MPQFRVEAYRINAIGAHDVTDALNFSEPDGPSARAAADKWLDEKAFSSEEVTNVQILSADKIVAQKEIGVTEWDA